MDFCQLQLQFCLLWIYLLFLKKLSGKKVENCHKTNRKLTKIVPHFIWPMRLHTLCRQSFVKSSEKLVLNKQANRQQLVCTVIIDY